QMGVAMANLFVVGTDDAPIGAATHRDGTYRLRRPSGNFQLRVTAPGYIEQVVDVGAEQSQLDVALRISSTITAAEARARAEGMRARMEEMRDQPGPDGIYEVVSVAPQLEGGLRGLQERIVYPQNAKDAGVEGRVFVTFIVDENGGVQDATIARSPDPRLSEAALVAVRTSEFQPGRTENGEAVKVRYSLPVNFVLRARAGGASATPGAPVPDVFEVVEQPPRLIGGLEGLQERVVYPRVARMAGIQGRVFVTFIVDEEGNVTQLRVARSADPVLDEAAMNAVRESEFIPGRQRGVAVKVRYSLPISFVLPDEAEGDG
ncbi:MAG: TonB family protein, partial [Bacteroidota bacterium]